MDLEKFILEALLLVPVVLVVCPLETVMVRLAAQGSPQSFREPQALSALQSLQLTPEEAIPLSQVPLVDQPEPEQDDTDFNLLTGEQRTNNTPALPARWVPQSVGNAAPPPVINLRPVASVHLATGSSVRRPYSGLADCIQTIIKEEGYGALYRGWFWTLLAVGEGMPSFSRVW